MIQPFASRRAVFSSLMLVFAVASAAYFADNVLETLSADRSGDPADAAALALTANNARLLASSASVPPAFEFVPGWSEAQLEIAKLATGDFDGDGRDDLAAIASPIGLNEEALYVYLQLPAGAFADPAIYPLPVSFGWSQANGLTVADLNQDGRDDIFVTQTVATALHYALSLPGGGFQWRSDNWSNLFATGPAMVADVDGDGHLDVVLHRKLKGAEFYGNESAAQVQTSFGDGEGNLFRHASAASLDLIPKLALGALDGDTHPDLLIASDRHWQDRRSWVQRNNGAGGWQAGVSFDERWKEGIYDVDVADANSDGRPDAVTLTTGGYLSHLTIYPQLADGSLMPHPLRFATGAFAQVLHRADFNGDGLVDFAHIERMSGMPHFYYLLQDGYGFRHPREVVLTVNPNVQFYPTALASGDFDGDGVKDMAVGTLGGVVVTLGKLTPYPGAGGLPGAPGAPTVVVGPEPDINDPYGTATVTLGAAGANGGSPIAGYSIYSSPSGAIDGSPGSLSPSHAITGLEKGVSYRFYARATNAAGMGAASALSNPVQIGALIDPDGLPGVTITCQPEQEGDMGTVAMSFWVGLDKPAPAGGVSLDVSTRDGNAVAGSDYIAKTFHVEFAQGEMWGKVQTIDLIGDMVEEPEPEFFYLDVSNPQGVTPPAESLAVQIYEDEWWDPRLSIGTASVVEGNAGSKFVVLPIKLGQAFPNDVFFDIDTSGVGPTAEGVDYEGVHIVGHKIPAGQTSTTVSVTVHGDTLVEGDEQISVLLSNPVGVNLNHPFGLITIEDDEPLPTLSIADLATAEGTGTGGVAHFVVSLSAPMPLDVAFAIVTDSGVAKEGGDFQSRYLSGLYIPTGETSIEIDVPFVGDDLYELDETYSVLIESARGATISDGTAVGTIVNDDPPPDLLVSDVSVTEGGLAHFTVNLSKVSGVDASFDVFTSPGTAAPGVDFTSLPFQHFVIPAGSTSLANLAFDVGTTADSAVEMHETFVVEASNTLHAIPGQGRGRILNDDLATISIGDAAVIEGQSGTSTAVFEIRLSSPMPTPVSFNVGVAAGGTATSGTDYVAKTKPGAALDIGRTRWVFEVPVSGDATAEANETFVVKIDSVSGAVVGDDTGVATIVNDDGAAVAPTIRRAGRQALQSLRRTR